jgi:SNF2 family DNA or RNA helicase
MIFSTLMPHQVKALDYLKGHDPCMLCMFLGSGKSITALAYAEHLKVQRILITSDKNNVINTWPDEIWKHTDYEVLVRPTQKQIDKAFANQTKPICVVVNYEYLVSKRWLYERDDWDLWIGDELSEVKDQRRNKFKATFGITRDIPHRVGLNGKLMTERLEDIWGQMAVLGGKQYLGRTMTQFRAQYMMPDNMGYGWMPKRSALTQIQRDMKEISYWLKEDGSIKMPTSHHYVVEVDQTDEQEKLDEKLRTEFAAAFNDVEVETEFAAVIYQKRVQLYGGILRGDDDTSTPVPTNKLPILRKIIDNNQQSKIVVWHNYIPETALLSNWLDFYGCNYYVMDSSEKHDVLQDFADAPAPAVLLIRTSLCKGLNQLADADVVVYWSNPMSYMRRAQSEGRTRRVTSKTEDTHYIDLITKGGADAQVYQLISQKKSFSMTLTNLRKVIECETL